MWWQACLCLVGLTVTLRTSAAGPVHASRCNRQDVAMAGVQAWVPAWLQVSSGRSGSSVWPTPWAGINSDLPSVAGQDKEDLYIWENFLYGMRSGTYLELGGNSAHGCSAAHRDQVYLGNLTAVKQPPACCHLTSLPACGADGYSKASKNHVCLRGRCCHKCSAVVGSHAPPQHVLPNKNPTFLRRAEQHYNP